MSNILLVHIGMPKTGSTALQSFLFSNRNKLENYGWRYPLLASELPDVQGENSLVTNGNFFYDFIHEFEYGMDTKSDNWDKKWNQVLRHLEGKNVILSSEAMSVYETEKFLTGAIQKYNNIKAVIYLRRQDRMVESFYNNRIRDGVFGGTFKDYLNTDEVRGMCHYLSKLELVSRIIGKENLIVKVYEKQQFSGQGRSIEEDFLTLLNIEKNQSEWEDCGIQNPSIYGNYYNIRKIFNSLYGINSALDKEVREWEYNDLFMQISNFFHGEKEERGYFEIEERKDFLKQFVLENEQIAKEYLDRKDGILFYDNRIDYPLYEEIKYSSFEEDMIRIFSAMICAQNQKIRVCMQDYQNMRTQYELMLRKTLLLTIEQKKKMRKILLFAAGNKCRQLIELMDDNDIPITVVVDNDPAKEGLMLKNDLKVICAKNINDWLDYFTIVTCLETDEIEAQLQKIGLKKEVDYILAREYGL